MMSTSSLSRRPNRSPLRRWRVASERFRRPARQSPRKPAVKPSGRLMFKPGRRAVCRAPSTANSRTCHHEPSTRPSPACARSSVLTRNQPPVQLKSTVLGLALGSRSTTWRCRLTEGVPEERWISSTFPPNSPRCLRQGQVTEAWLDFLGDMQVGDQGDRSVDHLPGSGNDTGAAAEPGHELVPKNWTDGLALDLISNPRERI